MSGEEPWDMLADKKIWDMLINPEHELNADNIRLMFIELFRRTKNLEYENNTLKVLLFLYGLLDEKVFSVALAEVKEFFKEWDEERAKEIDFFANSGISFYDWAAFTTKGKFDGQNLNS